MIARACLRGRAQDDKLSHSPERRCTRQIPCQIVSRGG